MFSKEKPINSPPMKFLDGFSEELMSDPVEIIHEGSTLNVDRKHVPSGYQGTIIENEKLKQEIEAFLLANPKFQAMYAPGKKIYLKEEETKTYRYILEHYLKEQIDRMPVDSKKRTELINIKTSLPNHDINALQNIVAKLRIDTREHQGRGLKWLFSWAYSPTSYNDLVALFDANNQIIPNQKTNEYLSEQKYIL